MAFGFQTIKRSTVSLSTCSANPQKKLDLRWACTLFERHIGNTRQSAFPKAHIHTSILNLQPSSEGCLAFIKSGHGCLSWESSFIFWLFFSYGQVMHLNTQSQAWSDTALRCLARVCLLLENDARHAWLGVCGGARSCVLPHVGEKKLKNW